MIASDAGIGVTIEAVNKTFGAYVALDDIHLAIKPGEFISLLGPSGSGKTTLLMILAGFARPDSGSIKFGGTEVVRMPPHLRNIGMMFQNYALFPHMTVGENVAYPLRLRRIPKAEIAERVLAALSLVQLEAYSERRIDQLSGGQRQRVALARAIVFRPRVLLMDEPLSALDKNLREHMQVEIRQLHEKLGMTTITVTHDQREALTMSDRVAVIDGGKLKQFAPPMDLYEKPANRFVASFIGESAFVPLDGQTLVVRPERLVLCSPSQAADGEWISFSGQVQTLIYQGDSFLSTIKLESCGTLIQLRQSTSRAATDFELKANQAVAVRLHRKDAIFIDEAAR